MAGIRDRIKELRRVRAGDLIPHPKNWRTHPESQRSAMRGVLEQVGWADAVLARETPDGLQLIDGHLRAELDPDETVPVLILDVDESEADVVLATHDPLAGMAEQNQELLASLLKDSTAFANGQLAGLLTQIGEAYAVLEVTPESTYTNKIVSPVYEPKGDEPPLTALIDREKTAGLIEEIDAADIEDDVKQFLRFAAERHTVFNFRQIAEFYCHADATVQDLMERSGLVIIDFDKAIEYGFVHLTERLGELADREAVAADA